MRNGLVQKAQQGIWVLSPQTQPQQEEPQQEEQEPVQEPTQPEEQAPMDQQEEQVAAPVQEESEQTEQQDNEQVTSDVDSEMELGQAWTAYNQLTEGDKYDLINRLIGENQDVTVDQLTDKLVDWYKNQIIKSYTNNKISCKIANMYMEALKDKDLMSDTGGKSKSRLKEPKSKPSRTDLKSLYREKNLTKDEKDPDIHNDPDLD
jgi:hypothetical protein